ncbi:hypothetical protein FM105_06530 [Brevibacterium yomogidense]|uniref:Uncharacterized protein n=1 Tax=Brevibacterium yomogidense TaxID=946573 RepID=A0A1X6XCL9_9MICO|nr:hypothetical protein FM105_06530 [Brevibacterium yomogidense]
MEDPHALHSSQRHGHGRAPARAPPEGCVLDHLYSGAVPQDAS